jgi:hypothetical protein
MTGVTAPQFTAPSRLRWTRIVVTAFLLELTLFVVLVPIGVVFGMPGAGTGTDFTVFFAAVPIGCFGFGALFGWWMGRRILSHHAMHGVLLGVIACVIYVAVCSIPPNTIAAVVAGYGPVRFWLFNGLRVAGCVVGTVASRRR